MNVVRTQREGGEVLREMVELVRNTYSETMPVGDSRGLARLEHLLHAKRVARSTRGTRLLVASFAVLSLVAGAGLTYRHLNKVTYEVMNGAVGPGGFVRPTATGTAIVFSEGSEITLGASARTRVDNLTADGGRVVVESGKVHARIVPRKLARWVVEAGPYTIRVTGTAFDVEWSWADERLDIRMDRGSVIVTGPLAPAGVRLTAGMRLVANPSSGVAIGGGAAVARNSGAGRGIAASVGAGSPEPREEAPAPDDSALTGPLVTADLAPQRDAVSALSDRTRPTPRPRAGAAGANQSSRPGVERRLAAVPPSGASANRTGPLVPPSGEPWDRQLARGDVQGILNDAEARGLDRVLVNASGRELSALADAARYGHRPTLARRVLLSVRERFSRSNEARDAAFFLGALAEDAAGTGGPSAALEWYERYLTESGNGRYGAQALGRKMVLTHKLEGAEAARPVASEYLDRFPGGPYASAARKLMRAP